MRFFKALCLAIGLTWAASASAIVPAACTGSMFNPLSDVDWNNMFPITVAGVPINGGIGNSNPPDMYEPPICVCPSSLFGMPLPGIGITYWEPLYLAEVERRPGCFSSLGGSQVLSGYANLHSEQSSPGNRSGSRVVRMQTHWFEYPLFSLLDMFLDSACKTESGFALAYMTEIDATWQDDAQGAFFSPEAAIFANPLAMAACAVDAVASSFNYPLEPLFWCAGTWGNVYPLTGNTSHSGDFFAQNNQIAAKFIARNHRLGLMWRTIGPSAICSSHIDPIWVKGQYRYNQVAPIKRKGRAVVTGSPGILQSPPIKNTPTNEHTVNLIWQGKQCCARF